MLHYVQGFAPGSDPARTVAFVSEVELLPPVGIRLEAGRSDCVLVFTPGSFIPYRTNTANQLTFYGLDNAPWAQLRWSAVNHEILGVFVREDLRRQGLATFLYRQAKVLDPAVAHATSRTPDGESWARSLGEDLPVNTHPVRVRAPRSSAPSVLAAKR